MIIYEKEEGLVSSHKKSCLGGRGWEAGAKVRISLKGPNIRYLVANSSFGAIYTLLRFRRAFNESSDAFRNIGNKKIHVLGEIVTNSFMLSERFAKKTFLSQKLTNT